MGSGLFCEFFRKVHTADMKFDVTFSMQYVSHRSLLLLFCFFFFIRLLSQLQWGHFGEYICVCTNFIADVSIFLFKNIISSAVSVRIFFVVLTH